MLTLKAKTSINNFLIRNPHPADWKVHKLAHRLNIAPDKVEEYVYTIASRCVKK